MKKLHFVLVKTVINNLQEIFIEEKQADKVIPLSLKENPKFGSRDRKFVASASYDIVRWWRFLHKAYADNKQPSEEELFEVFYTYLVWKKIAIPEWKEFENFDLEATKERLSSSSKRVVSASIPDWLDELVSKQLGEETWEKEISAMNNEAELIIRSNRKKISSEDLIEKFSEIDLPVEPIPDHEDALWVKKKQKITGLPLYAKGLFEVHDLGSQLIAPFLQVEAGMTVIDACAGAGGKTLHLANIMKNKGKITSMDIYGRKLQELRKRADRNGTTIVQTNLIKEDTSLRKFNETADRLLLDVPCSGLGVLKRNPDTKWKLTPEFLKEIQATQASILANYTKMLKSGGMVVYATCSILPDENENQVANFLRENSDFELIKEQRCSPTNPLSDGYYMALLKKA